MNVPFEILSTSFVFFLDVRLFLACEGASVHDHRAARRIAR